MPPPDHPKVYHIVHVDRLPSIIADGFLWSDAEVRRRGSVGTTVGMSDIKRRRLEELELASHPGLRVGECAPFYFCSRSVMLYLLFRGNHAELTYRGGQDPIVHLEADMREVVAWAEGQGRRWAFTRSNAGSYYFEDFRDWGRLGEIDWDAIAATDWRSCKEEKQAEFLVETSMPWHLVRRIGVRSRQTYDRARSAVQGTAHQPRVSIEPSWYY